MEQSSFQAGATLTSKTSSGSDLVDYTRRDPSTVLLAVTDQELLALKGALLEANEAIRDDMAFSARIGISREEAQRLFDQVIEARRLLA